MEIGEVRARGFLLETLELESPQRSFMVNKGNTHTAGSKNVSSDDAFLYARVKPTNITATIAAL